MVSDVSYEMNKYMEKMEAMDENSEEQLKEAECECCGMKEDCTLAYFSQVQKSYLGKWVCGLCSEAVKEIMTRTPKPNIQEAVASHKDFCQNYNRTTRLNPKLSLTCDMRNIARRSCEKRNTKGLAITSKLARSTSCNPRIGH
ncbi:hypothetical protein UlMin_034866 [Ulmus minor]